MDGIGSGKVIASGPDDKIFVFFSDHGATNLIAFPEDYLYADVRILFDFHWLSLFDFCWPKVNESQT